MKRNDEVGQTKILHVGGSCSLFVVFCLKWNLICGFLESCRSLAVSLAGYFAVYLAIYLLELVRYPSRRTSTSSPTLEFEVRPCAWRGGVDSSVP